MSTTWGRFAAGMGAGAPSGRRVQYAALPYRVRRDGEVQLRLITSRETRRWVIPKGWPIKGLTPPKTAAREAYEEAGLVGVVSREPVGLYTYEKRLGTRSVLCDVLVFPLKVKRLLDKWPERFQRYGFWFSIETAAAAVQEADLAELIRAFGDIMARKHEDELRAAEAAAQEKTAREKTPKERVAKDKPRKAKEMKGKPAKDKAKATKGVGVAAPAAPELEASAAPQADPQGPGKIAKAAGKAAQPASAAVPAAAEPKPTVKPNRGKGAALPPAIEGTATEADGAGKDRLARAAQPPAQVLPGEVLPGEVLPGQVLPGTPPAARTVAGARKIGKAEAMVAKKAVATKTAAGKTAAGKTSPGKTTVGKVAASKTVAAKPGGPKGAGPKSATAKNAAVKATAPKAFAAKPSAMVKAVPARKSGATKARTKAAPEEKTRG